MSALLEPPIRQEFVYAASPPAGVTVERPLSRWQRWSQHALWRKAFILLSLALLWEGAARWTQNDLLLPSFIQTAQAFIGGIANGELLTRTAASLVVLLQGYAVGVLAAFVLTLLAVSSRIGRDVLETLTAMLNPLPAIALLPLALLWFGLGRASLIFVIVHSVMWPLALNTYAGFQGVPETLRMAGRNYGLNGLRLVLHILVPGALPSIVSGLKIGWAFAWRTLIAAELVFGTTSGQGGLGWYIFQNRNELYTDKVFAGLAAVIVIGLIVENIGFRTLERVTLKRWGMQR
ncbi:ABC transporter permease [Janthinobacterium agaricidamnosum]|uniref:ABC transporter permease n=1 Tax=Janthinobacterium agaricidamnosum TaxID=55508 RepID=A0A3G2EFB7_9BURK|nr:MULTISPECIES: ABC transporter permease [Janthinobacterium]AYM78542.1 ABC transporter permease [Janthinobacterium agaricidamnosum]OEZ85511.1 putative aliphatic sulfonates transport permease protein SsuC [Janthinobacterium sp. HH106]